MLRSRCAKPNGGLGGVPFIPNQRRRGAYLIELAAVLIVFLMLLFGIIEYCRFIFTRQVVVNAAREGARFAVVNTTAATLVADTQAYVKVRMASLDSKTKSYTCQVYRADSTGKNNGAPTDAQFGEYVAVEVNYEFVPFLPSLLRMNNSYTITSKALMYSEAN